MIWTAVSSDTDELGNTTLILHDERGCKVSLFGHHLVVADARSLFDRESEKAAGARKRITGERMGYAFSFIGPGGPSLTHVEVPAPGVSDYNVLLGIMQAIMKSVGGPIQIINFWPLPAAQRIVLAAGAALPS